MECIRSLAHVGTFSEMDTIVQMARCSFDIHMQDIVGTLIVGATLVMLHPKGNMDYEYLAQVLRDKQVTYMHAVPTVFHSFFDYIKENNHVSAVAFLQSVCSGGEYFIFSQIDMFCCYLSLLGESLSVKLVHLLKDFLAPTCRIWNLYGPAETTMDCTFHLVDHMATYTSIPIGRPLPNYQCLIFDEFSQPVYVDQKGELLVGGVGVFAGYLSREDLTAKTLVNIDGHMFYRTGDLVRMDDHGLIHYIGRKDHQVKLRGQRIELGEIERFCVCRHQMGR
jgi:non-ribosomal peptide synthetase component F